VEESVLQRRQRQHDMRGFPILVPSPDAHAATDAAAGSDQVVNRHALLRRTGLAAGAATVARRLPDGASAQAADGDRLICGSSAGPGGSMGRRVVAEI
jgi:hypothetical protein